MLSNPDPTQSLLPSQSALYPCCLNPSLFSIIVLVAVMFFKLLLVFFNSVESSSHIVALQDIPLWKNSPPVFCKYKCFFPPATDGYKPRVAVYVREKLLNVISILPMFFARGDLTALNFHCPEGRFDASHNLFCLYNAYSIPSSHNRSVSPLDLFPQHDFPTLVLRDLNPHHPPQTQPVFFPTMISS